MKEQKIFSGFTIVVLDRGFIYVGHAEISNDSVLITNAHNIRSWGTRNGLGQLALEGPQSETKLDKVGTVRAPIHALIHTIDTDVSKWNF